MPGDEGALPPQSPPQLELQSQPQLESQPRPQAPQPQQQKRELSEDATTNSPTDQTPDGNKRRRPGTSTSSRGVANLTPDQLAKKRANDREAQRAIRERTKNQIESLERQIRELTSQQPYQETQNVLRQKELVEAENADIKRRLASVIALIQPIIGTHG